MKKNPLNKVARKAILSGYVDGTMLITDEFGNQKYPKIVVQFEALVFDLEGRTTTNYRGKYGVDSNKKIVRIYLNTYLSNIQFDLTKLGDTFSTANNSATFSIIDRNQSNLLPITKVFGSYLICTMEGMI